MAHGSNRRDKKRGIYPCSDCSTQFNNRRNRRRHRMLQHSVSNPRLMNYPPQPNQSISSGMSKTTESRSVETAKLLEVARAAVQKARYPFTLKSLQLSFPNIPTNELRTLIRNRESDRRSKFETCKPHRHHDKLVRRKKLCECQRCVDATAEGRRSLPQRIQVRARANIMFCPMCDEPLRTQGQVRSHYLSFHTTKRVLRNLDSLRYAPISEDEYSEEEYPEVDFFELVAASLARKRAESDCTDASEDSEVTHL